MQTIALSCRNRFKAKPAGQLLQRCKARVVRARRQAHVKSAANAQNVTTIDMPIFDPMQVKMMFET